MARKSNFNVNDLSTWSIPVLLFSCLVVIGLLAFSIKHFFVNDITDNISSTDLQVSKQEQEYLKNQKIIALLPHIRKEVAQLEKVRDEAKKFLPTQVSMPSLIDNVYLSARNNGIVFNKFTPEKDIEKEFYTIKPISLKAEIGYISMSDFIEEITTLKRIMNVHSVSFSSNEKKDNFSDTKNTPLQMTAQLRTYIFKDNDSTQKIKP